VYLTFDVEIWCGGWSKLDTSFPGSFDRYVYGRSKAGEYALPEILRILKTNRLRGVFFIEPLFAARFGQAWLNTIVDLIKTDGHDVQLHLHPEWSDEIEPLIFPGATVKRQHLCYYSRQEQDVLVGLGTELMRRAGCTGLRSFRSGSFAVNRDTYGALRAHGYTHDSSPHAMYRHSGPDMRDEFDFFEPFVLNEVTVLPMTLFRDGSGRLRPAQVGSASFSEMRAALESALAAGNEHFVILSHNFEMLKVGRSVPDAIVVARFAKLCRYLSENAERFSCRALSDAARPSGRPAASARPQVPLWATAQRHVEQLLRRIQ
jgi:hypothetical protein